MWSDGDSQLKRYPAISNCYRQWQTLNLFAHMYYTYANLTLIPRVYTLAHTMSIQHCQINIFAMSVWDQTAKLIPADISSYAVANND